MNSLKSREKLHDILISISIVLIPILYLSLLYYHHSFLNKYNIDNGFFLLTYLPHLVYLLLIIGISFSNYIDNNSFKLILITPLIILSAYEIKDVIRAIKFLDYYKFFLLISSLLRLVSYLFLVYIIILSYNNSARLKEYWIIPPIFNFISLLIYIAVFIYREFGYLSMFELWWYLEILFLIMQFILLLLSTYILKSNFKITYNFDFNLNNKNGIGQADKLLLYKELYDDGIITREEFEEKKNKIINTK